MRSPELTPVIVGVGQLKSNRERTLAGAREPLDLLASAALLAAADAGPGRALLEAVDRLDVVCVVSWAYDDLGRQLANHLGISPAHAQESDVGGNQPVALVDSAAARIADGSGEVCVIAGSEAAASVAVMAKAEKDAGWTRSPGGPRTFGREVMGSEYAFRHKLVRPVRAYPLYENGLRARLGQSFAEAQGWSGRLYSRFSEIAVSNEAAWNPVWLTPEEITTVTPKNRLISWPYPLHMNAFGAVDQASAVIVTSLARARELGVPEGQIVHVWGGAGASDSRDVLGRVAYDRAPAMAASLDATLQQAGVAIEDVDVLDLYSCFPVVPKLAAVHLGIQDSERDLTATGGLSAFGGPGNEYSLHAIVAVTDRIRLQGGLGLVYGNGEFVTKHHALLISSEAHPDGYVGRTGPLTDFDTQAPPLVETAEGPAVVETFTVDFDREGGPYLGIVIGRLPGGERFLSNVLSDDPASLWALVDPGSEPIGRAGYVRNDGKGRNLFSFEVGA